MKLHFLGANRQVTGSRYVLEAGEAKIMIDCGMFQEREHLHRNWEPCPVPAAEVDALVLTHAHLDHCGWIPRLVQQGFAGPIVATEPTVELTEIILRDSARIQMEDARYKARRHRKEGRNSKYEPQALYETDDVEKAVRRLKGFPYGEEISFGDVIKATFRDAGHILGSALIEAVATEGGEQRKIVFSGDIGQRDKPLIRDPTTVSEADYVILESTYGDREHREAGEIGDQLADVCSRTLQRGGNVVIPTFAVERAQELMYYLGHLMEEGRIPRSKVYLDSPMAIDVTEIFLQFRNYYDAEAWQRISRGDAPLRFEGLYMARSADASRAINFEPEPCIIMATSGMCTAGRIKHHLRRNIENPKSSIVFVGYQAHGTLGRTILDGDEQVRIHGRQYEPRAEIAQIYGFSGHADRSDLLAWLKAMKKPPRKVFLTHGEMDAAESLAKLIESELGYETVIPEYASTEEL